MGRYRSYRLHPLSLGELASGSEKYVPFAQLDFQKQNDIQEKMLGRLFKFGSFPEVFIKQDEKQRKMVAVPIFLFSILPILFSYLLYLLLFTIPAVWWTCVSI